MTLHHHQTSLQDIYSKIEVLQCLISTSAISPVFYILVLLVALLSIGR